MTQIGDPQLYLDIKQAAAVLRKMGLEKCSDQTVRGMADRGALPFFKAPDGRRRISDEQLRLAFARPQQEACRKRTAKRR